MTPEPAPNAASVYPLGKYLVLAELGRGGMAEVYLALSRGQSGFNKLVVLKLLRTHLAEDESFLRMFLAEARLAARLNHANIVQTYEIGIEGGRHCIVMEYLEGRALSDVESATRASPMNLSLGVRVLADTLAALHYAHELCEVDGKPLGLVHRDVSPHNLFVTYDGQVKLLDFGIAKAADGDDVRTTTGVFKGKLRYSAPERFSNEESDHRADIFSVGVILWQMLTGRHVWAGLNDFAVMQQLAQKTQIPPPRTVAPDVPPRLDAICSKALAVAPEDRFQSAAEMEDALEEYLAGESVGATNRALAKFMSETFGELRQRFQRTVDEQLRVAATVPIPETATASMSGLRAAEAAAGHESMSGLPGRTSSSRVRIGVSLPPSASQAPDAVDALLLSVRPSQPDRRRVRLLAAAALLGVTGLVGFVLAREGVIPASPGPASIAVAPPAVAPAELPSTAPAPPPAPPPPPAPSPSPAEVSTATAEVSPRRVPRSMPVHVSRPAAAPKPSPSPALAPPSAPAAAPPKREVDCSSPYFIDDQGIKRIRTECL